MLGSTEVLGKSVLLPKGPLSPLLHKTRSNVWSAQNKCIAVPSNTLEGSEFTSGTVIKCETYVRDDFDCETGEPIQVPETRFTFRDRRNNILGVSINGKVNVPVHSAIKVSYETMQVFIQTPGGKGYIRLQ